MAIFSVNNASSAALTVQDEFFNSVRSGNQQKVEQLLLSEKEGVDINCVKGQGTALHIAVDKADKVMVECLLNHRANPNIQKSISGCFIDQCEPYAALYDFDDLYGDDLPIVEQGGETPLWEAVTKGLDTIAKLLLTHGASPTISPIEGFRDLSKFAVVNQAIEKELISLAESILNSYGSYHFTIEDATELLGAAISSGNKEGIKLILNRFEEFYLPESLNLTFKQERLNEVRPILQKCKQRDSYEGFLIAFGLGKSREAEEHLGEIKYISYIDLTFQSVFESMDFFVSENEISDTFLETLKRVINTPDSNRAMLLNHTARNLNRELSEILLRYGADLYKAIEFAENEIEPSEEVIVFLKQFFGRNTKASLS